MELKLTGVARASLEELRRDYRDFLRQRGMEEFRPKHPALERFKARRCAKLEEVRAWVKEEYDQARTGTDAHGPKHAPTQTAAANSNGGSVPVGVGPCSSVSVRAAIHLPSYVELAANAALSLLNLCCYFLDNQLEAQADSFEKEGGFTERLYRHRRNSREQQ